MSELLYFDAFTRVGPRPRKHPAHAWKLSELVAEMDHCSISGALVAYTMSVQYDPMYSNLELCEMVKPHDHLFPVWNVMPHQTGEFPKPRELERLMGAHDVRAVTIHPLTNRWDWLAPHSRELLRFLESKRILTILDRMDVGSPGELPRYFRELGEFLGRHRRLPVLLTGAWWSDQRYVLPLLQRHKNLHISFDHLQIHYGIEDLVEQGFEDRLVFASKAPLMSAGAHRCFVDYAEVPFSVRQKIAGGNLTRLLGGLKPPRLRTNKNEDDLMRAARHGKPLPVPFIDMHMHILHEGVNGTGGAGGGYRMSRGGPKGVFHLLKRLGCGGGGFMSWNGVVSCDSLAGNECTRACLDVAPRGYWGLGTFDPTHYTQKELAHYISQLYRDQRFIGMKPYLHYGVEYHHASYDIWWSFGDRHKLYALIHRSRDDFVEVDTLAKKYPNVRWMVAHCGSDFRTADAAIECVQKHPNVYAEITLTPVPCGIIDYLVKHAGAERVVYGSDLPMRDPRQQLGWVVFSRLLRENKKKVLRDNALNIIAPCLRSLPAKNRP